MQKTSLFTNTVPESASGILISPESWVPITIWSGHALGYAVPRVGVKTPFGSQEHLPPVVRLPPETLCSLAVCQAAAGRSLFWGELLCGRIQMGGLPEVQSAGPRCLTDPPFQSSQCKVPRVMPQIPGLSSFSSPPAGHCVQWPGCMYVFNAPKFNLTG